MPASKRRARSKRKGPTPRARRDTTDSATKVARQADGGATRTGPATSDRYTPPRSRGLFRPVWHKVVGALLILGGWALFVVNDLEWFDIHLMPGGHNELWAILAVLAAGSSTWWFGWWDRASGQ